MRTRTVNGLTYQYNSDDHDPELEDRLEQSRRNYRSRYHYAEVQWWNASSIYVICPFCHDIHRHGFTNPSYSGEGMRVSECSTKGRGDYTLHFPFDATTGNASYSVNKERALFVAAGVDPGPYFARFEHDDLLDKFHGLLQGKRLWTEAKETRHIPEETCSIEGGLDMNLFKKALAEAVNGRLSYVRKYLETSTEAEIFLRGVEKDEDGMGSGQTTLHSVACERHPSMVVLLLSKGADPNAQDENGRTPLMLAALWGRLENVQLLLDSGADRKLVSVRDGKRVRAVDFAQKSRDNAEERNMNRVYRENVFERDRDREEIVRLLEDAPRRPDGDGPALWSCKFIGNGGHNNQLTMVAHFDRPSQWKTVGIMHRSGGFDPVTSMSGWGHEERETRISGEDWTDDVLELCRAVGFSLTNDYEKDHGSPGRFYACHSEKQLIAYFVKHHVFLDPGFSERPETPESPVSGTIEELMGKLSVGEGLAETSNELEALRKLRTVEPPVSLKKAHIIVCRPVCHDCERFVAHVNEILELDLMVRYSPPFER